MSTDQLRHPSGSLILAVVRWLGLPVRSRQFWIVQAGVLLVAFLDEIMNFVPNVPPDFVIPPSTIAGLMLVPVIYAALNFGVRGSVGTALWATVLMFHDWIFTPGLPASVEWGEIGNPV